MSRGTTRTARGVSQSREARAAASVAVISLVVGAGTLTTVGVALGLNTDSPPPPTASVLHTTEHASAAQGLRFEANEGQVDSHVRFFTQGGGQSLFLTDSQVVMVVGQQPALPRPGSQQSNAPAASRAVVRMDLVGANLHPRVSGVGQVPGITNYFIGNNPANWHTDIPSYSAVTYSAVWPGVDVVFHVSQAGSVEYDFVLSPGADPSAIHLRFRGAESVMVGDAGDLVLITAGGEVDQPAPTVYQESIRTTAPISGSYVMQGTNEVRFSLGAYNHSLPLVIDPTLVYSTFVGAGNGGAVFADAQTFQTGIAADASGNAYTTGATTSVSYPTTTGVIQPSPTQPDGAYMAYVAKLNPTGSAYVFSTFLGGSAPISVPAGEYGEAIAVDSHGNVFVSGTVYSDNTFPTTPGAYATSGGGFVSKLNSAGSKLVYSTFVPGGTPVGPLNQATLAVDGSGSAYVLSGSSVLKLNGSGTAAVYNLAVQGPVAIAVDAAHSAYVAGVNSSNQTYVAKLNSAGSATLYNFPIAGSNSQAGDAPVAVAIDSGGNAYITGSTGSGAFPTTPGAFQRTLGGPNDAFVAKVNATGTAIIYSTYLGGSGREDDQLNGGIAIDAAGDAYVAGLTASSDFPVVQPMESPEDAFPGAEAAFVSELDTTGSGLIFSSRFGGDWFEFGFGIALDPSGSVYLTGVTGSPEFPTTAAAVEMAYPTDAFVSGFVVKLAPSSASAPYVASVTPSTGPVSGGTPVTITGSGFNRVTDVLFGGAKATNVKVHSATLITAKTPPAAIGTVLQDTVPVLVNTRSGSSSAAPISNFAYGQGAWKPTGSLAVARYGAVAVELPNSKILVAGGASDLPALSDCGGGAFQSSAEVYDPLTGMWSATGSMVTPVCQATATLLPNGTVLVAGGQVPGCCPAATNAAQIYDPSTGTWAATTPMNSARVGQTMTLLQSGKVLVASGGTAEVYDPTAATWTTTGPMIANRNHYATATATLLTNGTVLVTGGCCDYSNNIRTNWFPGEIYSPQTNTWSQTRSMAISRQNAVAALLPNGDVLVEGGLDSDSFVVPSAEVYDPSIGTFSLAGVAQFGHVNGQAVATDGGGDLAVIGGNVEGPTGTAELFRLGRQSFISAGSPSPPRGDAGFASAWGPEFTATLITGTFAECGVNCGKILVTGGSGDTSAELYSPQPSVTSVTPNSGSHAGGTTVTITGSGLASVTSVLFGNTAGTNIVHDPASPDTKLTVVTQAHSTGRVDIAVDSVGGISPKTPSDLFQFR